MTSDARIKTLPLPIVSRSKMATASLLAAAPAWQRPEPACKAARLVALPYPRILAGGESPCGLSF